MELEAKVPDGMPDSENWERPAATMTALVEGTNLEDEGRPYISAFDPENPRIWTRVPVLVQGGGPVDYVYTPPIPGDEPPKGIVDDPNERQTVLIQRDMKTPGAMGCVPHPQMQLKEQAQEPNDDEDHDAQPAKKDFVMQRAGVKLIMDEHGNIVIDNTGSLNKVIRIQLPVAGILRISRAGQANGRLALCKPLSDHLLEVQSHLRIVEDKLNWLDSERMDIWSALKILGAFHNKEYPINPESNGVYSQTTRFQAVLGELPIPAGLAIRPPEPPAIAAQAIHVSTDVEDCEE
jgi:hypothetical protein